MLFHHKMLIVVFVLLILPQCSGNPPVEATTPSPAQKIVSYKDIEKAVYTHTNAARVAPKTFTQHLKTQLSYFKGNNLHLPDQSHIINTHEGPKAVQEAIAYLKAASSLPSLEWSSILARAAQDHVIDTGLSGHIGHKGLDNSTPFDRIERHGKWRGVAGENLSYGKPDGLGVVTSLIVDDGVKSRGHRNNIFNAKYRYIGVSCGPHKKFKIICVSVYAGEVDRK